MSTGWQKYAVVVVLLLLGIYVGAYYLLPWGWTGGWPPGKGLTRSDMAYNTFFYPMRWMTQRPIHQWDVSVEKVDLEHRTVLLMVTPRNGYVVPYRRRDDVLIRTLHPGDRIRASVIDLPEVSTRSIHWEFWGFVRVGDEGGGETPAQRTSVN